jgi:hypothetical protein
VANFRTSHRRGAPVLRLKRIVPREPVAEPPPDDAEAEDAADRWWRESSYDLRHGLEVSEEDTIPGELLDELFKPSPRR